MSASVGVPGIFPRNIVDFYQSFCVTANLDLNNSKLRADFKGNAIMVRMWIGCKYCRWCGRKYEASKPIGRDGFCSPPCKQAHYRAYKKYVTAHVTGPGRNSKVR